MIDKAIILIMERFNILLNLLSSEGLIGLLISSTGAINFIIISEIKTIPIEYELSMFRCLTTINNPKSDIQEQIKQLIYVLKCNPPAYERNNINTAKKTNVSHSI